MSDITYTISWNSVPGSYGYTIEYRLTSDSGWTQPSVPPNPTLLTSYDLVLQTGNSYYIRIGSIGLTCATSYAYYTLDIASGNCCPATYTLSPDESYCYLIQTTSPTIIQSNICLASSKLITQYSSAGSRLYNSGYSSTLVGSYTSLMSQPQWRETTGGVIGPMNRDAVWVDTDCNGTKDPLTAGQTLIITVNIITAVASTVYVGIGGDNTFRLDVNATTVVDRDSTFAGDNFNYWHIFPVSTVSGSNYFTFKAVGDGTTNDALGAVIYDNTALEISSASSDSSLNILFRTSDYIGEHIDIATCPSTYFLDTSGGSGSYICKRVVNASPIDCSSVGTFTASASFNYSIDSIAGTGLPSFPLPTGTNNDVSTSFSGTISSQTIDVEISGSNMTATKLVLYVDNVEQDCVNMAGADTYSLSLPAISALSTVLISIDGGTC